MRTLLLSATVICSFISQASAKPILIPCPKAEKVAKDLTSALESTLRTQAYSNAALKLISEGNERFTGGYVGKLTFSELGKITFPELELLPLKNVRPVTHCTYAIKGKPEELIFRLLILQPSK